MGSHTWELESASFRAGNVTQKCTNCGARTGRDRFSSGSLLRPDGSESDVECPDTCEEYATLEVLHEGLEGVGRKVDVLRGRETGECPKCGTELETESVHERDSSNDPTTCPKCKWGFTESELWSYE